jgi:DNA-binding MarR family transcriptional regulator
MMQQTSLFAYRELASESELGRRQLQVYQTLKNKGPSTNKQLSSYLNLPINSITGRTRDLVKAGLVEKKSVRLNSFTNRPEILWGVLQ